MELMLLQKLEVSQKHPGAFAGLRASHEIDVYDPEANERHDVWVTVVAIEEHVRADV